VILSALKHSRKPLSSFFFCQFANNFNTSKISIDNHANVLYKAYMDTKKHFQKIIKDNRKVLILNGFKPSMLTLYTKGLRFPSKKTAKRIAEVLHKDWRKFPVLIRR